MHFSQNAFSKLFTNAEMMADVLDEDMAELTKEDPKKKQEDDFEGNEEETEVSVDPGTGASSLWEDDDVKNFYENLGFLIFLILQCVSGI